jgi:hypothetical protein
MHHRPHDRDLTFYLQVYRDRREANWCLQNLRRHYPHAAVLLVSDGDPHPAWSKLARRHDARYVAGQRLYETAYGGRIIQRMLDLFAEQPTAYLCKIDTDTWAHRRLTHLPTGCKVFGSLEWSTWGRGEPLGYPNVQGGFVGYTREAAQLIRTSGLLLSGRLQDYAGTYADVEEIRRRAERGMVSTDFLTRYACRCLGIESVEFGEVRSRYRGWVAETQGQYAFTHPHKDVARRHPLADTLRRHLPEPVQGSIASAVDRTCRLAAAVAGRSRPAAPVAPPTPSAAASNPLHQDAA